MNTTITRVLVIEDDPVIRATLTKIFAKDGRFKLTFAKKGKEGRDLLLSGNFDLAIIDLKLPDISGRQVIKDVRNANITLPILVLTANSETASEIDNINGGANDYVTKPFDHDVLVSRAFRLVRDFTATTTPLVKFNGLTFDAFHDTVTGEGFEPIKLDRKPARVLELLLRNKARIVEPETIMKEVWENEKRVVPKTLTKTVSRLNGEFESRGLGRIVNFVTGIGYELVRK